MKRYSGFSMVAVAALFLSACIGSGGSPAPAPNNVKVLAKDSRVIVAWDMVGGVEYWVFHANGSGVTPQNCSSMPLCFTSVNVTSPVSVTSLYNGYPYSFSINGRTNGGPGGPGSVAQNATPVLAGTAWSAEASPTANNFRGVTYGNYDTNGARFIAAGTGGALYSGTVYTVPDATYGARTGITWTALTNPLSTTDFNAVSYDSFRGKYLSVGATGKMIAMTPSTSTAWAELTGYTGGQNLLAIASNSAGFTVVTGASGTIIHSADGGTTWTTATSITPSTTASLNGVAYGNGIYVAVGATGTLLHSTDGDAWTNVTSASIISTELKGVTYGLVAGVGTFVAVSADGKVITSTNGSTWTAPVTVSSTLNAVAASANAVVALLSPVTNAFVAVDNAGNIFRSIDGGVTWPSVKAGTGSLFAITRGGLYDYAAVGASGANQYAD